MPPPLLFGRRKTATLAESCVPLRRAKRSVRETWKKCLCSATSALVTVRVHSYRYSRYECTRTVTKTLFSGFRVHSSCNANTTENARQKSEFLSLAGKLFFPGPAVVQDMTALWFTPGEHRKRAQRNLARGQKIVIFRPRKIFTGRHKRCSNLLKRTGKQHQSMLNTACELQSSPAQCPSESPRLPGSS